MNAPRPDLLAVVQVLLAKYHAEAIAPLQQQVEELKRQLALHQRQLERGHRGKYIPGALYEKGDECSWVGSTWRALVNDPKDSPPSPEWALVAQGTRLLRKERNANL